MEKGGGLMAYWLFKSEPDVWGWDHQFAKGDEGEEWGGVRNYLARNNMRAMALGDLGFFYHSNIGKEIVGIVEVCRTSQPDSTTDDPRWDCVMIKAVKPMPQAVSLDECRVQPGLEAMALVKTARLSVQPVTPEEWDIVCQMGGVTSKV
jgi:predicted RNA-binding protein with PUA-like domain